MCRAFYFWKENIFRSFFDIDKLRQVKLGPIYVCLASASKGRLLLPVASTQSILQLWKQGWVGGTNTVQLPTHTEPLLILQATVLRVAKKHFHLRAVEAEFEGKEQERGLWREPKQRWVDVFCSLPAATKQVALKQTLARMPRLLVHLFSIILFHCVRVSSIARNYMDIPNYILIGFHF